MFMKLKIPFVFLIILIVAGKCSCAKKETFSIIPAITFKSLTSNNLDSAIMEVNFTDGDGDIGYLGNLAEAQPDFFIQYLRDSAGAFVPMLIDNGSGFIPVMNTQ